MCLLHSASSCCTVDCVGTGSSHIAVCPVCWHPAGDEEEAQEGRPAGRQAPDQGGAGGELLQLLQPATGEQKAGQLAHACALLRSAAFHLCISHIGNPLEQCTFTGQVHFARLVLVPERPQL